MTDTVEVQGSDGGGLDIDMSSRPLLIQMYGKQGSGKTVLCKALLLAAARKKVFDWVVVFTATSWNDYYTSFLPEHAVRTFEPQKFYDIFNKIQRFKQDNPKKKLSRGLVILDDVIHHQIMHDKEELLANKQ